MYARGKESRFVIFVSVLCENIYFFFRYSSSNVHTLRKSTGSIVLFPDASSNKNVSNKFAYIVVAAFIGWFMFYFPDNILMNWISITWKGEILQNSESDIVCVWTARRLLNADESDRRTIEGSRHFWHFCILSFIWRIWKYNFENILDSL